MNNENKRHHLSTSTIHRNELVPTEFSQSDTMHEKHGKKHIQMLSHINKFDSM